ncbi:hypothetical protein F5878DRAFT_694626 [Lentinula raphanica]|uniref:Uncharacterized protein n=1 Tax=Lentinula raphanica TaxID=153919 RepID=A0AA38P255_9AGAR|nr:hypothetical protein F5878DRAFT_694626 [Lentinula raphanica]
MAHLANSAPLRLMSDSICSNLNKNSSNPLEQPKLTIRIPPLKQVQNSKISMDTNRRPNRKHFSVRFVERFSSPPPLVFKPTAIEDDLATVQHSQATSSTDPECAFIATLEYKSEEESEEESPRELADVSMSDITNEGFATYSSQNPQHDKRPTTVALGDLFNLNRLPQHLLENPSERAQLTESSSRITFSRPIAAASLPFHNPISPYPRNLLPSRPISPPLRGSYPTPPPSQSPMTPRASPSFIRSPSLKYSGPLPTMHREHSSPIKFKKNNYRAASEDMMVDPQENTSSQSMDIAGVDLETDMVVDQRGSGFFRDHPTIASPYTTAHEVDPEPMSDIDVVHHSDQGQEPVWNALLEDFDMSVDPPVEVDHNDLGMESNSVDEKEVINDEDGDDLYDKYDLVYPTLE